jgi:hypothetical protein
MKLLHLWTCIVGVAACLLCLPSSHADTLNAGTTLYPAPGEGDPIVGAPLASINVPFSTALYSGTLLSEVYDNDITNPYDGLTFVYRLTNDPGSLDDIHRLTINNFADFQIDASYQDTAGLAATLITRSNVGTVGFAFFGDPLGPGDLSPGLTSALLVLQTDAQTFVPTFASVINGTITSVDSFSPEPIVPEPSTAVLLAMGAAGAASQAYRRRRQVREPCGEGL